LQHICHRRSFDDIVGALLEIQRHVEIERLGGFEVDHELELDRGLDWKIARLRAPEYAIGVGRRAPKLIEPHASVGQQAAPFSEESTFSKTGLLVCFDSTPPKWCKSVLSGAELSYSCWKPPNPG
jgi:hypothetical protein